MVIRDSIAKKMKYQALIVLALMLIISCSEEVGSPEDETPDIIVEPDYLDTLAGSWVPVYDKTFGFRLSPQGIEFLRTPITTGELAQADFGIDSIDVRQDTLSIYDSQLCFPTTDLPYSLEDDTLTIDGLYGSEEKYVRTQIGEPFFDPAPDHQLKMTVRLHDSTFTFVSSSYNRNSNYTINGGYIILVAEMDDLECFSGPNSYEEQIRFFYFIIEDTFNGEGTYTLNNIQYGDRYLNKFYSGDDTGTLTVTEYDSENGVLRGTFSGELTGDLGSLSITEGSFSYYFGWID